MVDPILITRKFDAPRDLVYRAWTTPDLVGRWWSAGRGKVTSIEIDLRVGGAWRYVMQTDDGDEIAFHGEYREIVPGERLVYTEVFESRPDARAVTTITFQRTGGGTTLEMLIHYDNQRDRDEHARYMREGLTDAMDLLEQTARSMTYPVIYSMSVSLDGFTAGPSGEIDWAAPDDELMRFHNEQTLQIGAHLCGRRLYEAMLPWEAAEQNWSGAAELEFARIWTAIPKVVFSTTLDHVEGNASLARDDVATEVAALKEQPGRGLISVGGAGFAAGLIKLDLIDEYRMFVNPVVLGGGTPYFPSAGGRLDLELAETRTFGSRVVYLRYRRVGKAG